MKKGPDRCIIPWTNPELYKMDENKPTGEPKQCSIIISASGSCYAFLQ